jgi:hypothetical protein
MKTPLALLIVTAAIGCADPPLLEAPGAEAVAVGKTADAVALWQSLANAGLVDGALLKAAGPALVADSPMIASALPSGVVVVAARISPAAAAPLAVGAVPVLGETSAVTVGGARALVRVDKNRALIALRTTPADEATVAALLEVMAGTKSAPVIALPKPGAVEVRIAAGALPIDLGAVEALVVASGNALDVDAAAPKPSDTVRAALVSASPPFSCDVERGASVVVGLPPFPELKGMSDDLANPDAFDGRLLIAAYPGDGVLVAGVPKGDASAFLDKMPKSAAVVVEGPRRSVDLGKVHAVSDRGLFAFALGKDTPIATLGKAECPTSHALVRLRAGALPAALLSALPAKIGAALASLATSVDAVSIDSAADGPGVRIGAHVALRSVQE